ncbi:hypothetical protein K443DRAFT_671130 [Laccaria amethystina LaAM-08-1]|uniref:Glutaredoxin domain-containing protein n=1 Tax=Laccaria amethystina LaAM-08-1 TaxID=1095629 RepID=A0A0C9XXT9_9AGAR|nr:hypothetical protein K443DRAFT_671130 [Laccaria amethystina LaAM-08-1]
MVASPSLLASIRRRRCAITTSLLVGFFFYYFIPWGVPSSLRDIGISGMSRASVAQLVKTKKLPMKIDEIYGLLHLVTGDNEHEHVLSNDVHLDPTHPIDMSIYAAGEIDLDWEKESKFLNKEYPIVVFSKTYCPYSKRAKDLLAAYDIQPPPKIVEVDLRDDNNVIKLLLSRLTHHSTFPNILIQGKSIGGSDDLFALHNDRTLAKMLERAGVTVRSDGSFKQ